LDVELKEKKTICLFLPKDTQLDLLLLYLCFVLKEAGRRVLYLGADVSIKNPEELLNGRRPILCLLTCPKSTGFRCRIYQK